MNYTIKVGDTVRVMPRLYIEDYDYGSHHFNCSIEDPEVPEKYTNIFIPAKISVFGYRDPPEIYYKIPSNFNPAPQTIINKGHYLFKPLVTPDFEKTGKVFYDCWEAPDISFEAVDGVRCVKNEGLLKLIGHTLAPYRIKGVVNRIYRKKLGPVDDEGRGEDLIMYVDSVSVNDKYNSVVMMMASYICVITIDDYEIYIPSFFVRKFN